MRILFLTQIVPYPPDAGPKIKTWRVLKYLAGRGHEIILATFVRDGEQEFVDKLRHVCTQIHTVPLHRSRSTDVLYWIRSMIKGSPFLIERDDRKAMRALVDHLLKTEEISVIHADQLNMAQFALTGDLANPLPNHRAETSPDDSSASSNISGRPTLTLDAHNAVWTVIQRMQEMSGPFLRPLLSIEGRRIKRYEGMIVHHFDRIFAVTQADREALLKAEESYCQLISSSPQAMSRIFIIPIAVDTHEHQPIKSQQSSMNILTLGTMHYPPNADGIRWFLREVFPSVCEQIPEATLTIVGKNPPSDLVRIAARSADSVRVTGYVTDLKPYLEAAAIMVVPVRAGGGMRVRILEGLAWGIPMVTTTIGLEGIDAIPGKHILVADDVDNFNTAVCSLLRSESLKRTLSENARQLAVQEYDWRNLLDRMDLVYG